MPRARTASLVHSRIERSYGGPHVGTDTFSKVLKVGAPVKLDATGRALLTCELESCRLTYNVRVLPIKERVKIVLKRAMIVAMIMAVAASIAMLGGWVYDAGTHSQGLRVVGDVLVGVGMAIYFVMFVWTLMSFWFWPDRYKLEVVELEDTAEKSPVPRQSPDVRAGHSVKLRRAKP